MRTLKNGKIDKRVMSMIVRNYDKLKDLCIYRTHGLLCSKSYEDIFHDAILFVSQDNLCRLYTNLKERGLRRMTIIMLRNAGKSITQSDGVVCVHGSLLAIRFAKYAKKRERQFLLKMFIILSRL